MGLFIATVLGYSGGILAVGSLFVYFLRAGLDSSQAEIIDPKPTTKY